MRKVLIIVPAYNEAENLDYVVQNIQNASRNNTDSDIVFDYILVNDGSKDHTAELCRQKGYQMLDLPVNLGLTNAVRTGMQYAQRHHYDMAIQFDGDGQHDAAFIMQMVSEMLRNDVDIVIGSRFATQAKPKSLRMMGNNLIEFACRLTTGQTIRDTTSGMRLYNHRMIEAYAKRSDLSPEPDTIAYLIRCGAKVSEVQVEMHERMAGTSYLTLTRSIRYMIHMGLSIVLIQWFRKDEI